MDNERRKERENDQAISIITGPSKINNTSTTSNR